MSLDVYLKANRLVEVYTANITHNLGPMAKEAGLYEALWRPEEINVKTGFELILHLEIGLKILKDNPERFKKFNPENGWGNYEGLVNFVEKYLEACKQNCDSLVKVSR